MSLCTPESIKGGLKLAVSISVAGMAAEWAKEQKYLPDNLLKYILYG